LIAIIFGAGASYGSGRCNPHPPPLGAQLFDHLENLNGEFSKLDENTKIIFREKGFEEGMARVNNSSIIINPLQKELASYLSQFTIEQDNAYARLFRKIKRHVKNIKTITLNYDLLIEQSLSNNDFPVDYNNNNEGATLLKPHGSSNFLPKLPTGMVLSGNTMQGNGAYIEGLATQAVSTKDEIVAWCNDPKNSDLSPILAMYAEGKRVVINPSLVKKIQEEYTKTIHQAELIIIIGVRYMPQDEHIWRPIEDAKSQVVLVDPYPKDSIKWAHDKKIEKIRIIEKSFDKAVNDIRKEIYKSAYKYKIL